MRIPLAPAGLREITLISLLVGVPAAGAYAGAALGHPWCWPVAVVLTLVWVAGLAFFRDPERSTPPGPGILVAPADGRVVETSTLEYHEETDGPATRIGIFLSVFDVHVNRSPCCGVVRSMHYQPGQYLDARRPESGRVNEANTIVIEPDGPCAGPIIVRQIAGKIARRIVCSVKVGARVETGQRIGLIKFGSRTELIMPAGSNYTLAVNVGDKARGAVTIMARCPATARPDEACSRRAVEEAPAAVEA